MTTRPTTVDSNRPFSMAGIFCTKITFQLRDQIVDKLFVASIFSVKIWKIKNNSSHWFVVDSCGASIFCLWCYWGVHRPFLLWLSTVTKWKQAFSYSQYNYKFCLLSSISLTVFNVLCYIALCGCLQLLIYLHWACIKFYMKLGKSSTENLEMLPVAVRKHLLGET